MTRIAVTGTASADPRVRPAFEEHEERTGAIVNFICATRFMRDLEVRPNQ